MRVSRVTPYFLSVVFLCGGPLILSGCGGGPAPGTMGSPVDPDEAAKQNKAMQDYYRSKGKKGVDKSSRAP